MSVKKPAISVLCVTFNHENFIKDALEGFVSQQLNVPFEVLVGDDCSTDGTSSVIRKYASQYPHIIKPILHKENIGASRNFASLVRRIQGKYVALCDGDDYWTDTLKLQKQYDFLESFPDYSMCFHLVRQSYDDGSQPDILYGPGHYLPDVVTSRNYFKLADLLRINVIASLSVLYRWKMGNTLPEWMLKYNICDLPIHLIHADIGKIGYIDEEMGTYRKHARGSWWNHETPAHKKENSARYISLLEDINASLNYRNESDFRAIINVSKIELAKLQGDKSPFYRVLSSKLAYAIRILRQRCS
ncbi:glycosyltransferase [Desulfovibrio aerotolerans]|uniref:Glycosyltransferase n=1 Tax=Solidesulfovibrio aerotolerans TaxID=295255 RepID=A0A7C9MWQ8_9BACT|nr:glycosyltransferase [Solidesulfovibrio aerotolerans]MYL84634.1 glycosyltransferase [Solidesulfovibrio aerotolerans]